jgi:hypothetical protein
MIVRRRWWALVLVGLAACGGDPPTATPPTTVPVSAEPGPEGSTPPVEGLTAVLVAADAIPKGTPLSQVRSGKLVAPTQIPGEFRPTTAVADPAALGADTLVAREDIAAGAVIVEGMFAAP